MTQTNKTDEKTSQERIKELDILNMSDEDLDFCSQKVQKLYNSVELYEKARQIVKQLGLAGLWRGYEASILIVANAIEEVKD